MAISSADAAADQYSDDDSERQQTNATELLAVSCMRCGEILPVDVAGRIENERRMVECTRCRRVAPIVGVFSR